MGIKRIISINLTLSIHFNQLQYEHKVLKCYENWNKSK